MVSYFLNKILIIWLKNECFTKIIFKALDRAFEFNFDFWIINDSLTWCVYLCTIIRALK